MGDAEFSVVIVPNQQVPVLDISDLSQYQAKKALFEEDRTLRTFLEMAITQFSINKSVRGQHFIFKIYFSSNLYSPVGPGRLYEVHPDNQRNAGNGIVLRSGLAKGVRVVQNYGNPSPALVLDGKTIFMDKNE
jgi:hypothetical protein